MSFYSSSSNLRHNEFEAKRRAIGRGKFLTYVKTMSKSITEGILTLSREAFSA